MRHSGHDIALEIAKDTLKRFCLFRRCSSDFAGDFAGLDMRSHRHLAQIGAIG
jgi:hypothetical protein